MTEDDLCELATLDGTASAAPWHIAFANDAACMSATFVTKNPSVGRIYEPYGDPTAPEDVIAACLVSEIASADDCRWDENARLIAAMRNHLPELIRLARLGLAAELARMNEDSA